ncbi:MAG TPA: polysaccharide deacetylase family protein [Chitinophagaceae bacterium]|nr:polysaccharide deacetylase family protein [Chitinophagaceae bacterium]
MRKMIYYAAWPVGLLLLTSMLITRKPVIKHPAPAIPKERKPELPIKYIYLTFDDGPLEGSEHIDSVVLQERLKISVFLVGQLVMKNKKLQAYLEEYKTNPYIETYNHSYTHANGKYKVFYSRPVSVLDDIQQDEAVLGLHYKIVRLPGRNIWRLGEHKKDDFSAGNSGSAAADTLAAHGYKIFGWDTEWQHRSSDGTPVQTVDEMVKDIETRLETGNTFTKDHIVVLIHDEMFRKTWEESELKQLIDKLRTHENYVFEHVRFYPSTVAR